MDLSLISFLLLLLLSISFLAVILLSVSNFITGNTCPKLFGIPVCYVLIIFIALAIISQLKLINDSSVLFFIGTGLTLLIAIYASVSHLIGSLECPKFLNKIPMCYLSLLTFGFIMGLKIYLLYHY